MVGPSGEYGQFARVSSDGTFGISLRNGTFTIQVWTWQHTGGRRSVGWYGGESGFTTDPEQATAIVVDGAYITDIEIRLPAGLRGTVLDSEGEPVTGIGLGSWGGSPDNFKFGQSDIDGTFYIVHENGTFTLRIYIRKDNAWHPIGWYGEGGFTTNPAAATSIELSGADATGIEVRLPVAFAALPPPTVRPSPTQTPTATPSPTPTPAPTPTPRPTPTPTPIPLYPEIVFVGDVDPTAQADYRASMEDVVAFYSDRYGVETEFAVYIGADIEAIRGALQDLGMPNPALFNVRGTIRNIRGTWALLVAGAWADARVLAHEYFHVLQQVLSNTSRLATPRWLVEGGAVYQAGLYAGSWESYRPVAIIYSSNCQGELSDFESFEIIAIEVACGYPAGAFASEWLARHAGAYSHIRYWELLRTSRTWEDAFTSAFEIAPDEFYEAFEEHIEESLSERAAGRVEGAVLGPDGEGLHGIGLALTGNRVWIVEPNQAGRFGLHVFNGMYRIELYADVGSRVDVAGAPVPRRIGWYGGATGFTTDPDQATVIEVDGADVTGIEIRLPADPSDLPTIE